MCVSSSSAALSSTLVLLLFVTVFFMTSWTRAVSAESLSRRWERPDIVAGADFLAVLAGSASSAESRARDERRVFRPHNLAAARRRASPVPPPLPPAGPPDHDAVAAESSEHVAYFSEPTWALRHQGAPETRQERHYRERDAPKPNRLMGHLEDDGAKATSETINERIGTTEMGAMFRHEPNASESTPSSKSASTSEIASLAETTSLPAERRTQESNVSYVPVVYERAEQNYEIDESVSVVSDGRVHGVQATPTPSLSTAEPPDNKTDDGQKVGYVVEGRNYRKYRVEERTSDGFIVGEYGVVSHDDGSLRGVRYTADGTINPRVIYEALMKFLAL